MASTEHEVVIAGAGPTGLMLAAELVLGGIDVLVVERRPDQELDGRRAGGLHARTLEVLDQRGVADRFVSAGTTHPFVGYGGTVLDVSDFPTRHNYLVALWQKEIEVILARWVDELGVAILRHEEVVGLQQDGAGVDVELARAPTVRARYLVGCDGGRSVVRKASGIDFPGFDASRSYLIAEAEMEEPPAIGVRPEGGGIGPVDRERGGSPYGIVLLEAEVEHEGDPTLQDLRDALVAAYGTDYGVHTPTRVSRFTDMTRQAAAYRKDRVLLAGDAAHVHGPFGGQGLNVGVQDAVNLGWKLARVVRGTSPERLLDTYHAERHPVGARVLRNTMAQVALTYQDERSKALRETVIELLGMDEPRRRIAGMISGLDIRYELGDGHPLIGRRMPDLDLRTAVGPTTVFALLHDARPVLLNLGEPGELRGLGGIPSIEGVKGVKVVEAAYDGPWLLPVAGEVEAPAAVLVRPDGYVAWAGRPGDAKLSAALETWFGGPAAAS